MFNLFSWIRRYRSQRYMHALLQRGLKIGVNTHIMDGVFLDPAHCFLISIGNNCTLAPNVRIIAHDASMRKIVGATKIALVTIHDNCFIGDSALILPGVSLGPYAIVGAGSVVTKTVAPYTVVAGNPARVVCPYDAFAIKHRENLNLHKTFAQERCRIDLITHSDREEMIAYLRNNFAYMGRQSQSVARQENSNV